MMKVLLIARWPVGGIRTYIRYIYSNSVFSNYEITLIAPDLELRNFLSTYLPESRIKYRATADNNESIVREIKQCLKEERYDLIHSHGFSAGVLTSRAIIFMRSSPHIMTVHDVYRDELFRGVKGKLKLLGLNVIYRQLDAVLTVGEDCYQNFIEYMPAVRKAKLINIDHGVDVERFSNASKRDFKAELGLPSHQRIIGFFGRFMAQKGFSDLVGAMKILSETTPKEDMPLVLTFGWGGFIREEYQRIEELGLQQFFRQLPFTDDMPSAIKGVDMVVMPSRWEACGLLAMEVLSAGVPLIGTSCIGLRCVLKDTPAYMVNPSDPAALAGAIEEQLRQDDQLFKDYQPLAIKRFNLEEPAAKLHQAYLSIRSSRS